MSDCSTESMKPKEPPKTCGTCGNFARAKGSDHLGICSEIYFEDEYGNDAFAAVLDTRVCDNPSLYKPRMTDCDSCPERLPEDACKVKAHCYDLQERCQQLEQVARDALAVISMACSLTNGDPEMRCVNLNCKEAHKSLRSRLEALGVSVDE